MFDLVRTDDGSGRHAFNEDAALTPIFHALTRGGWRSRQHEPAARHAADPVDEFRRDPLTAPIPMRPPAPAATTALRRRRRASGAHALGEQPADPTPRGRHHTHW